MFTQWLLTVFPDDLRAGWRLLRANLVLWISFACASALAVPVAARMAAAGSGRYLVVLGILTGAVGLAQAVLCVPLFDDAYRTRATDWTRARQLLVRRAVPLLLVAAVIVRGGLLAAGLVMIAARAVLQETPVAEFAVPAFGILVYLGLLVRFCYAPFLVVLFRRSSLPGTLTAVARPLRPALAVLWPFLAAARLSEGRRWRLVPYVALLYVARFAQSRVPDDLQVVAALATALSALLAQAILFRYFCERMDAATASARS